MGVYQRAFAMVGTAMFLAAGAWADDDPTPQTPESKPPPAVAAEDKSAKPNGPTLDRLKLPPGAILLLGDEAKDALRALPRAVVLTLEKYQELLEQIDRLKRLTRSDKAESPSVCKLTGQVEGELLRLHATYEFRTTRPKARVALGCLRAWPTAAKLDDDEVPLLQVGDEGWFVQVETPGPHRLSLDVAQVLIVRGSRGAERGIDLSLPRAAITTLERFEVSGAIPEIRVGGRVVRTKRGHGTASRIEGIPLGPVDRLDLVWKALPAQAQKSPPLLAAKGRITVRVDESHIFTDAELTLEVLREETTGWRIHVPLAPQATLEKLELQDERILSITYPDAKNPVLAIRFKDPSAEPLRITLRVRQPRLGTIVSIGPFVALDAQPQGGTIEVRAPAGVRLRYHPRGEVSQREPTEEQRRENAVAVFAYWNVPGNLTAGQTPAAPLAFEVETIKGAVEARVAHALRMADTNPETGPLWRLATRIDVTPIRSTVDHFDVQLPPDFQYDREVGATPADLVEDVVIDPETRIAQVRLAQKQTRPFSVTLPGIPALLPKERTPSELLHEAAVELPQPLTWAAERSSDSDRRWPLLDRGGQVTVNVPDGIEIIPQKTGTEGPATAAREQTWQRERAPARIQWFWRPHRPEFPVDAVVDLTLTERQARVLHRLHLELPPAAPSQLLLHIPSALAGSVRLLEGGKLLTPQDRTSTTWAVALAEPGTEQTLILEYSYPQSRQRFEIPLVVPTQATRGETKVRVWSDPGIQPLLAGGSWEEQPIEVVPERRESLPALVLRGGMSPSLSLQLTETAGSSLATTVVERVLVRVSVAPQGQHVYRARFLLSRLSAHHLDIEMPVPAARLHLAAQLNGQQLPVATPEESTAGTDAARIVRLKVEPELYRQPVILDLMYQLEPARDDGLDGMVCTLQPPRLRGGVLLGRARWLVECPPRVLPLQLNADATGEHHWSWWGWLLAPRPASSGAELDRWLTGADAATPGAEGEPSLVCWQMALGPLRIMPIPQQVWLILCSLGVLALGTALCFMPVPRTLFWSLIAVIVLVPVGLGVLWPDVLTALAYGSEPGILALLLVLATHAWLQHRYRRQVVFMPGFTRMKSGSSLIRNTSSRPREPSTVDEPPKRGSSLSPEVRSSSHEK